MLIQMKEVKARMSKSVNSLEFSGHPCPAPMGKMEQLFSSSLEPDIPIEIGCCVLC